jgi:HAD superfamily hydrolase (TIGR01509 family)
MINPLPSRPMSFSAIFFDFDGILVDTEWAIYQAWKRTFAAHGQLLPLDIYTRCIGSDFATWSPKIHLEELTGKAFDWHDLDQRRQAEIMKELAHAGPMHGAENLLSHLTQAGMPMAVVSSSSHDWVDGWLTRTSLGRFFTHRICRGDAPKIKPAPDLYLQAATTLSVSPEHCLVIEDSLNGIKAAKAAGMSAWAVPNRVTDALDFSSANRVFRSLDEVKNAL